jgi:CRISPR-associated protein Cmr3
MWELEHSLRQHGIEIAGWVLPPPGDPWDIGADKCEEVDGIPTVDPATLPIEDRDAGLAFLPYDLETSLESLAERMGHPLEAYQLAMLCVSASLISAQTRLVVDSFSGAEVPPILWGGLVGDPGSSEIFIINTVLLPLGDLQVEHNILYTTDHTAREAERIFGRRPERGLLVCPSEMTSFLQSISSSRGGRGSQHSRWISLYDGNSLTIGSRTAGQTFVQCPSVSVIGRIQPSDIQHRWPVEENYSDDIWACFAWMRVRLAPIPDTRDRFFHHPRGLLEMIYRRLQTFPPAQYVLSRVGQQYWREWVEKIDGLILNEPNERIRIALSRTKERAARVALVLHCLDAAYVDIQPRMIVPADTLCRAIGFVYRLQKHAAHIHNEIWGPGAYKSKSDGL